MNRWKRSFIWLAGINVLIIVLIIALVIWLVVIPSSKLPSQEQQLPITQRIFTIHGHKKQLTQMINDEIGKHSISRLTFHVEMTDTLNIIGSLKVVGLNVPFELIFSSHVKNGNIFLTAKSAKIARVKLPESEILRLIKTGDNIPSWVVIDPSKKQIAIQLYRYNIKGNYVLVAKKMNLAKDQLLFDLYRVSE